MMHILFNNMIDDIIIKLFVIFDEHNNSEFRNFR